MGLVKDDGTLVEELKVPGTIVFGTVIAFCFSI